MAAMTVCASAPGARRNVASLNAPFMLSAAASARSGSHSTV